MKQFRTPPEVAKYIGVSPEKVLTWIRAGELRATNLASAGSKRPRWHVSNADLIAFLESRANPVPVRTVRRRRRAAPDAHVFKYF